MIDPTVGPDAARWDPDTEGADNSLKFIERPLYYDDHGKPCTVLQWSKVWSDTKRRVVQQTRRVGYDRVSVSTAFLGIDHGFGMSPKPLIFETMIFGGSDDCMCWRWPDRRTALEMHRAIVRVLRAKHKLSGMRAKYHARQRRR